MNEEVHTGGCTCGAIRYEVTGEPLFVHACHCTDCQTRTGSAFGLTMMLTADQFKLTRGTLASVDVVADSGNVKTAFFCDACGTHLWNERSGREGIVAHRPGTFDETGWFEVGAHIWTRSKQAWVMFSGDVPVFEIAYDAEAVWPAESLARVPDDIKI